MICHQKNEIVRGNREGEERGGREKEQRGEHTDSS
jgi:hypothetical protein